MASTSVCSFSRYRGVPLPRLGILGTCAGAGAAAGLIAAPTAACRAAAPQVKSHDIVGCLGESFGTRSTCMQASCQRALARIPHDYHGTPQCTQEAAWIQSCALLLPMPAPIA